MTKVIADITMSLGTIRRWRQDDVVVSPSAIHITYVPA
jgi:hypothetical protein